jgi:cytochrome b561
VTHGRYTATAIGLHWLVAALVLATIPLGLYMTELPLSPRKLALYAYHKWIGVTVFLLAVLRLLWRLTHRPPPHAPGFPAWQRYTAHAAHALLYFLVVAVPVSGWVYSSAVGVPTVYLGLWQLPDLVSRNRDLADALKLVHNWLAYGLTAIVAVHIAAALKHHFIDGDGVLARMVPHRRFRSGGRP